ncbi:hypothetical protein [Nonomuraea sp. NPDC005650]|uniref:hypothetical protein n=1 Tax=Nonomuraea sp. NPDC005650 TaxID=3157045 RepID=UPI0033AD3504
MRLMTKAIIVAAMSTACVSAAAVSATAAPAAAQARMASGAHTYQAVPDEWILWGRYPTLDDCRRQGDWLTRNHPDKWWGMSCERDFTEPLTPYALWMLSR